MTTAGRFFEAAWLVNGNGTRTTSPNSKGIVGVIVGIVPDRGKDRRTRGGRGPGERALLLTQPNEIHEILDLADTFGRQRLNLLDQGLRVCGHKFFLQLLSRWRCAWLPSSGPTRGCGIPHHPQGRSRRKSIRPRIYPFLWRG